MVVSVLVFYHYPCPDGAFAALAAKLRFGGEATTLVPYTHGKPVVYDASIEYDTVFFLDCIGPPGFVADCTKRYREVIVLDHHKSIVEEMEALAATTPNLHLRINMNISGCMLAAVHFGLTLPLELDTLFRYIEDHDLWAFKLKDSKLFAAGLRGLNPSWLPADLDKLKELTVAHVMQAGATQTAIEERWIEEAMAATYPIVLGEQVYTAANSTHWEITSELGHRLAQRTGFGAIYNPESKRVSLRTDGNPKNDVSIYAASQGGGGHAGAAAFRPNYWPGQ